MSFKFTRFGYNLFGFFNQRFLVELFYNKYITGTILALGGQTNKILDKGSIELIGPFGLEKGLLNLSKNIANMDTGVITSYALYILVGLIFYILILTFGTTGILDGFFSFTDGTLSMFPIWFFPNAIKYRKPL
jgi:NADH-ubiquinone oxidoreductase chain 5